MLPSSLAWITASAIHPLVWKLHGCRGFSVLLSFSSDSEQCLARPRYSINTCWVLVSLLNVHPAPTFHPLQSIIHPIARVMFVKYISSHITPLLKFSKAISKCTLDKVLTLATAFNSPQSVAPNPPLWLFMSCLPFDSAFYLVFIWLVLSCSIRPLLKWHLCR